MRGGVSALRGKKSTMQWWSLMSHMQYLARPCGWTHHAWRTAVSGIYQKWTSLNWVNIHQKDKNTSTKHIRSVTFTFGSVSSAFLRDQQCITSCANPVLILVFLPPRIKVKKAAKVARSTPNMGCGSPLNSVSNAGSCVAIIVDQWRQFIHKTDKGTSVFVSL